MDETDGPTRSDRASRPGVTGAASSAIRGISSNAFRRRRFNLFLELVEKVRAGKPAGAPVRVLDVGGVKSYWEGLRDLWGRLPLEITIVNIGETSAIDGDYRIEGGDACALQFADNSFDIAHSNSVIEHVGRSEEMKAMAREVSRVAPHYFVQTPNFWFPFEPHYRTLFMHWWPEPVRARMLMRRTYGFRLKKNSMQAAMEDVQSVVLLSPRQLQALFPDAEIKRERAFGLTKSIIAVR